MTNLNRERRKAKKLRHKKPQINPYFVRLNESSEQSRAKLIDDALVYVAIADVALPRRLFLSVEGSLDLMKKGIEEWISPNESMSLLRPGYACKLAVDSCMRESARGASIQIIKRHLLNSGKVESERLEFRRTFGIDFTSFEQVNQKIPLGLQIEAREMLKAGHVVSISVDREAHCICGGMLQMLALKRRSWSSMLSLPNGQNEIAICSEAAMLREMFQLRDRPEGKTRRDALLHIVSGHWRKRLHDDDSRIWIEKYLRGKTEFEWFGLQGRIDTNGLEPQ